MNANTGWTRPDLSDTLIHFTKGEDALDTLLRIIQEGYLLGGTGFIKGRYPCVCFSETPLGILKEDFERLVKGRYSPFGIGVSKKWLFEMGGRPVIYQPANEFLNLSENIRWRHVTYDLGMEPPIDFTWEREWRISCEELKISADSAWLVVPDFRYFEFLKQRLYDEYTLEVELISQMGAFASLAQAFVTVPQEWKAVYLWE